MGHLHCSFRHWAIGPHDKTTVVATSYGHAARGAMVVSTCQCELAQVVSFSTKLQTEVWLRGDVRDFAGVIRTPPMS
eukprot:1412034-Amphidinium_carterae.1